MKVILDIGDDTAKKVVDAKEATCEDCKHFIQHFRKTEYGTYEKVYCGHCTKPRVKSKSPLDSACAHFQLAE